MVTPRVLRFWLIFGLGLLCAPSGVAYGADNWIEVRSPHFTVSSNAGEKEARKIADQFEQIRQMFHASFATLRVDTPEPIVIIAAKNENTMKVFLPEEWETKGHIHHAGLYQAGQDKDYVILRLDTEDTNPYHTLYHEYTHALLRLNFTRLPLWLDEGIAEFYGNSTIQEKEIRTGTIDRSHLYILNQNKLIPIEKLLEVDHGSPYYSESNRASVFYAESWALVHYLMMDADARQAQLLKKFLASYSKSNDQVAAANESFGDLKKFGQKIEAYARQSSFQIGVIKMAQVSGEKAYPARALSAAEVLAERGDFYVHHNRSEQAKTVLEQALKQEPNLAAGHAALGFYYFRTQQPKEAEEQMQEAIRLGSTDFLPYYVRGLALERNGGFGEMRGADAEKSLEQAIKINPEFAPAYEALSHAYAHTPEGQKQAVAAALKAMQLDPGTLHFAVNLGYALINSGRTSEARLVANRIGKEAETPVEKQIADSLGKTLEQREEWDRRNAGSAGNAVPATLAAPASANPDGSTSAPRQISARRQGTWYAIEGEISDSDCSAKPEVTIDLTVDGEPIVFHAADLSKVTLRLADALKGPSAPSCGAWKGRKVTVRFRATSGKEYAGEITELDFF
jgi:Tfp pilus assembly protein PilF